MAKQQPIEIFMPPNILKAKVGGTIAGLDMAAVRRAEAAMETLKTEFAEWIGADVQVLVETRDAYEAAPDTDSRGDLYRASHDLKGQALTFEYPLVARVASSLCKLLDEDSIVPTLTLVDAHVNAIRVIVRDKVKDNADIVAKMLAEELETRVGEVLERGAQTR